MKEKVIITFQENGQNGGPYHSHERIIRSTLAEKYEFIPLIVPRFRKLIKPKETLKFVKFIRNQEAKILHFSGLQLEGFHVLLLAKIAGIKTICAVRGSAKDALDINSILRKVFVKMEEWTLAHADACYGVSRYVSEWDIIKKHAKNCVGYIYNFVEFPENEKRINKCNVVSRNELNIDESDIVIVSTGRITKDKGYEILLDIIKNVNKKQVKFLIVGDGDYKKTMEEEINSYGLSDNVIFTGYRKDVADLLEISDLFITCTLHETLGNSIIEASYHSLPVIATNTGGIPEIVNDKKTGFLFNTGDIDKAISSLLYLIQNEDDRKKMGRAGKEHVLNNFNCEKIETQLDNIYQLVIKGENENEKHL